MSERVSILLIDPKFPHNVGGALRAAACFGATHLRWTGTRVPPPDMWPEGARLPREERMKINDAVDWGHLPEPTDATFQKIMSDYAHVTPICVEKRPNSESLTDFVHPNGGGAVVYVFGPEDGNVPKGWRHACHRFLCIPTLNDGPLNLAAAVNVVLWDRMLKLSRDSAELALPT